MKKKSFIILIIVFIILIAAAALGYNYLSEEYTPEETNQTAQSAKTQAAPDFTVTDYNGNSVNLSDYKGKNVIVNFWATWCGPCKSELPAFDNMYDKYKDQVEILMVNMTDGQRETVDIAKAFVEENGYTFPVFFDTTSSAANTYSVYSIPLTLFIDKDGNLLKQHTGAMSEKTLERYVTSLINR